MFKLKTIPFLIFFVLLYTVELEIKSQESKPQTGY